MLFSEFVFHFNLLTSFSLLLPEVKGSNLLFFLQFFYPVWL
jgi:hypothetical protein